LENGIAAGTGDGAAQTKHATHRTAGVARLSPAVVVVSLTL